MMDGGKVWITDQQLFTIKLLEILNKAGSDLNRRADQGEHITYSHFAAYVAEEVTSQIPPGTHYLRDAYDKAKRTVRSTD